MTPVTPTQDLTDLVAARCIEFCTTHRPEQFAILANDDVALRAFVRMVRMNAEMDIERQQQQAGIASASASAPIPAPAPAPAPATPQVPTSTNTTPPATNMDALFAAAARAATAAAAATTAAGTVSGLSSSTTGNFTAAGSFTMGTGNGAGPSTSQTTAPDNTTHTSALDNNTVETIERRPILLEEDLPPPVAIILPILNLSSLDYISCWFFQTFCTRPEMPFPLRFLLRVLKNKENKKIGSTQFRLMEVDMGNGRRTTMVIDHGSVLYQINGNPIRLVEGSYFLVEDVDDIWRGGAPALKFSRRSKATALPTFTDEMWQMVVEWQRRMAQHDQRRYLQQ